MNPHKKVKLDKQEKSFFNSATVHEQVTMESNEMLPMKTSNVLILYTGGTIGMKMTIDHVYEPVPNYFSDLLMTMRQFHDPYYYLEDDEVTVNVVVKPEEESSIPKSEINIINNVKTKKKKLKALVTPISLYGKRTIYTIFEYEELIDSANVLLEDWVKIATDIEINYNLFDAFIILHGTDTMAYSASALSFMLENLGKTVIITGSQVPLSEVRNDAIDNLLGALTIASHYIIPEVTLFFNQKLFRGNRTKKVDATNFNAFDSPNMKPLVKLGININVSWKDVLRPTEIAKFQVHKNLNHHVALLRLFPGISYTTVKSFLTSTVEGIILESYGAGNAPDKRKDILQAFKEATDRGVIIVNCTQCTKGSVSDIYATGKVLTDAGLISGKDMTTECALAKLSYLLGKNISRDAVKQLIKTNLRGELSDIPKTTRFSKFKNPDNSYIVKIVDIIKSFKEKKSEPAKKLIESEIKIYSNVSTPGKDEDKNSTPKPSEIDINEDNQHVKDNVHSKINKILLPSLYRIAAITGDIAGLHELLEGWPSLINDADYNGQTGLHLAAKQNHLKTSEYLFKMGSIVHTRDNDNHTPLWYAVTNPFYGQKKQKLIELFVKSGAVYASDEIDDVNDLLFKTVKKNDLKLLKDIIASGIDINTRDDEKRTIVHLAAIYRSYDVLYYLKKLEKSENNHFPVSPIPIHSRMGKTGELNSATTPTPSSLLSVSTLLNPLTASAESISDNVSFNGAYILEEIDQKREEMKKVTGVLQLSNASTAPLTPSHKIEWHLADRWGKTAMNYLQEDLKNIQNNLSTSDNYSKNEKNKKDNDALLERKNDIEKVIEDIFTYNYINIVDIE